MCYNLDHFSADKMNARATEKLDNVLSSDVQLFYLLKIIENISILGQTQFKIFNSKINEEVINKLRKLGYHVNRSNEDFSLVIRWRNISNEK